MLLEKSITKIHPFQELLSILKIERAQGKRVVLSFGCFDLLHLGHIRHFKEAKKQGDILVVVIQDDSSVNKGPDRPFFTEGQREESLSNIESVDFVSISKWPTALDVISKLKPDVYAKGIEYKKSMAEENPLALAQEVELVSSYGGTVYYTDDITFSSSSLINRGLVDIKEESLEFLENLKQKRPTKRINDLLDAISKLNILVIGDVILDEYHYTHPLGMSSKSANISVRYLKSELHAGGILAIANHTASFVNNVKLFTICGDDGQEKFIKDAMKSNVDLHLYKRKDKPTVRKSRFINNFEKTRLFEVSFIENSMIPTPIESTILKDLEREVASADVVILADFGHYFITENITRLLEEKSKFLSVNVQTNSLNYGYNTISKIKKADYISIDEKELRMCFQDNISVCSNLIHKLLESNKSNKVAITLGEKGSYLANQEYSFAKVPTFTSHVVDTVGAGDAYLALSSLFASQTEDLELIGFMGTVAGGIATKYLGNKKTIDKEQVMAYIKTLLK